MKMELFGFNIGHGTSSMYLSIFIYLCYLTLDICTAVIPPSISISETSLTAPVNGILELRCDIDKLKGSPAGFQWQHTDANSTVHLYDVSSLVPRVTVGEAKSFPTYSMLTIKNLSVEDSGQIRCIYYYPLEEGVETVSYDAWLCVSDIPDTSPMICSSSFLNDNVISRCVSTHTCPDNVTLQRRQPSDKNLYEGNSTRNVSHAEKVLVLKRRNFIINDKEFICKFESESYPDVALNCTISAYVKPGMPEVSTTEPATSEPSPETFSRTSVIIIIASAVGIELLLFIGCCLVLIYCKKRGKGNESKPDNEDDEASYAEITESNITDIEDTASTELELEPNETTNEKIYERKITSFTVDDSMEDHGAYHVYVNDWRFKEIQK